MKPCSIYFESCRVSIFESVPRKAVCEFFKVINNRLWPLLCFFVSRQIDERDSFIPLKRVESRKAQGYEIQLKRCVYRL